MPSILLINCVGSYLYSIMEHLSKEDNVNGTLYYLAQSKLKFQRLSMEEVQEKYKQNPWGYQPIKIVNQSGNDLEIDDLFFTFLHNHYHIKIDKFDAEKFQLMDLLLTVNNETSFLICTVDEMYLENSVFYKKRHNKHFLLIKNVDFVYNTVDIVDSEKNRIYTLKFDEIKKAIMNSLYKRKVIYRVDGQKYKSDLAVQMKRNTISMMHADADYFDDLIADIENKKKDEIFKFEYYYRGYYYNIVSKIIPYYFMCTEIYESNSIICKFYQNIVTEWKRLAKYMKLKMYRNDMDGETLIRKIEKIKNKFRELDSYKVLL